MTEPTKEEIKELKNSHSWCYIWDCKCKVALNCDNRCHRYDKKVVQEATNGRR